MENEITSLEDQCRKFTMEQPKIETTEVTPTELLYVTVGRLLIINAQPDPGIAYGTRVYLDGKEVKQVKSLTLNLRVDEQITCTMETYV